MTTTVFRATRCLLNLSSRRGLINYGASGGAIRQIVSLSSSSITSAPSSSSSSLKGTLQVSDACKKRLKEILDKGSFLRVSVEGGGCSGFQYKFNIEKDLGLGSDDVVIHKEQGESGGSATSTSALVVIDELSLDLIQGSTLDYETELIRSTFRIVNNPHAEQGCSCGASFNMKIQL
ncbi:unnamed protein product [Orchesella dallaii]|uniref:Core domain-containing protein n=1 Tax=Orchesella dallaii TaxID=48710 RepID=A0ABP1R9T8_9HEXA